MAGGRWPGRCELHRLGPLVCFFFKFYIPNQILFSGDNNFHHDERRIQIREGGDDETGPNDARRVIWALGEHFFISLCISLVITNVFYAI